MAILPSGRAQVVDRAVRSAVTSTGFPVFAARASAAPSVTGFALRSPPDLPCGPGSSRPRPMKVMPVAAIAAVSTTAVVRPPGTRRPLRSLRVIGRIPLPPVEPARDRARPGQPMMAHESAVVTHRKGGAE